MKHTKKKHKKNHTSNRLTYSQLLSEDRLLSQSRAVPPAVPELVLALVETQLGTFANGDDGVGATLTKGPLTGRQSWYLVADDVGAQSHHRGQRPVDKIKMITHRGHVSNQSHIKVSQLMWSSANVLSTATLSLGGKSVAALPLNLKVFVF